MVNPKSKAQWQEAIDSAHAALTFDAARMYGLVTGGPKVDVDRCLKIFEKGKKKGLVPADDAID